MAEVRLDQAAIDRLLTSPEGPVGRHLLTQARQVENGAKRYCPVDTGLLRSSITHDLRRDNLGLLAAVGSRVHYAAYVELGTRYMAPRAFLRRALAELR